VSETDWIKRYIAPLVSTPGAAGLRDDVAALSTDAVMIATMDTLVEGVHFLPADRLATVGQKLLRVNISDVIAKGAAPCEALLSVAWPRGRDEAQFADLMSGIGRDLAVFEVALIGGDTVTTDGPLVLTMTLTGRCLGAGPVRRSGANAGANLWLSGPIGWGHIGLQAARTGGDSAAAKKYQVPEIGNLDTARQVARLATASIDVSDGLLIDVRLAQASGCGAQIALDEVPLARPGGNIENVLKQCTGGDDYKVLLAAPAAIDVLGFTQIGALQAQPGLAAR